MFLNINYLLFYNILIFNEYCKINILLKNC